MSMLGRVTVAFALLTGAIAGAYGPSDTAAAGVLSRPNIVVIMTDDQPLGQLDAMPFVRSFIEANGVTYPYSMVPTSLCCPSRTSFLTGRYSHETGIYTNAPPNGGWPTFNANGSETETLATWLSAAGYETALVGKYLNRFSDSDPGYTPPGWDTFIGYLSGGYYYDYTLRTKVNGPTTDQSFASAPEDYSTDVLGNRAVAAIQQSSPTQPLFLMFTPMAPHAPQTPASRHLHSWPQEVPISPDINELNMSDKPRWMQRLAPIDEAELARRTARQHETLMAVDEAVQKIVAALGDRAANTLFVFTSDNGLMMGSHRWQTKGMPHARSTLVPLLLRWDGHLDPATSDNRVALNIDVTATILQASGVDHATSGLSLLNPNARPGTVLESSGGQGSPTPPAYCGWRSRRWLFVEWTGNKGRELYDYRNDPYELHNLAMNPDFRGRMIASRHSAMDACSPVPPGFTW